MAQREFTGRHAAILFCSAFGVIIAVNVTLAVNAVATFPGLEAKNTYVASQEFDTRRDAQQALGWTVSAQARGPHLVLSIRDGAGHPVRAKALEAVVGRATHVRDDVAPDFRFDGQDYLADLPLGAGNWNLRLKATALDGTEFQQRVVLHILK